MISNIYSGYSSFTHPAQLGFINVQSLSGLDRDYKAKTIPYILSNEVGLEETYAELKSQKLQSNSFHIGFSCWFNYDLMAIRASSGALLIDRSTPVHCFMNLTKETIIKAKDRHEFVRWMSCEVMGKEGIYYRKNERDMDHQIEAELSREGSWLSSDQGFIHIKRLYLENRIFHIRMNITDENKFLTIKAWLQQNGLNTDTVYVSNIGDWLSPDVEDLDAMSRGIQSIASENTLVIDSSDRFIDRAFDERGLKQKVIQSSVYHPGYIRCNHED